MYEDMHGYCTLYIYTGPIMIVYSKLMQRQRCLAVETFSKEGKKDFWGMCKIMIATYIDDSVAYKLYSQDAIKVLLFVVQRDLP